MGVDRKFSEPWSVSSFFLSQQLLLVSASKLQLLTVMIWRPWSTRRGRDMAWDHLVVTRVWDMLPTSMSPTRWTIIFKAAILATFIAGLGTLAAASPVTSATTSACGINQRSCMVIPEEGMRYQPGIVGRWLLREHWISGEDLLLTLMWFSLRKAGDPSQTLAVGGKGTLPIAGLQSSYLCRSGIGDELWSLLTGGH